MPSTRSRPATAKRWWPPSVGSRATGSRAIALGGIVTFTHTASVIVIGLLALFASNYIMPDVLVPGLEVAAARWWWCSIPASPASGGDFSAANRPTATPITPTRTITIMTTRIRTTTTLTSNLEFDHELFTITMTATTTATRYQRTVRLLAGF
ncbi:MAG: hypothetical protein R2845_02395 [Thermomicrobiales bacterium]